MKLKQLICLSIYYGFARYLPASYSFGGKISKRVRYAICKNIFKKIGHNVNIERKAYFGKGTELEIGNNSGLGVNCRVHPNTVIGDNVMMGPNVYMLTSGHVFSRIDIPMIQQGCTELRAKVVIGNDVWIGQDVMILGSKVIKTGSIIGARCLLTKNFPEYSIIGGNPSVLIRIRKNDI